MRTKPVFFYLPQYVFDHDYSSTSDINRDYMQWVKGVEYDTFVRDWYAY